MNTKTSYTAAISTVCLLIGGGAGFQAGRVSTETMLGQHYGLQTNTNSLPAPNSEAVEIGQSGAPENSRAEPTSPKPIIGIASTATNTYIHAIELSGGVPVILPNTNSSPERIQQYLKVLDGLLMPGGPDIPPSEYGEEQHPTVNLLDDDRYQFEKQMITAWIEQTQKPLLGICLGSQWVNVAHGGSLIQDIPSEFGVSHRGTNHMVSLAAGSRLASVVGSSEFEVNSYHHQAVRRVGRGLRAVAKSPEGIVEATESTDPNRFLIGVQWHPEKLVTESDLQANLLKAFVKAAALHSQ